MKILVCGLGGAGQRHTRVLKKLYPRAKFYTFKQKKKTPLLDFNLNVILSKNVISHYNFKIIKKNEVKQIKPNIVVLALPSSLLIKKFFSLSFLNSVFILEKPLITKAKDFNKFKSIVKTRKIKFLVVYQRRCSKSYLFLKKKLKEKKFDRVMNIDVTVNSNVKKWHNYESFKNLYALRKDLGGGVIRTECHEIDIIHCLFGSPISIKVFYNINKIYNIETSARIIFCYDSFKVNFNINFFSNKINRNIKIKTKKNNYNLDLNKNILKMNNKIYKFPISSNDQLLFNFYRNFLIGKKFYEKYFIPSIKTFSRILQSCDY